MVAIVPMVRVCVTSVPAKPCRSSFNTIRTTWTTQTSRTTRGNDVQCKCFGHGGAPERPKAGHAHAHIHAHAQALSYDYARMHVRMHGHVRPTRSHSTKAPRRDTLPRLRLAIACLNAQLLCMHTRAQARACTHVQDKINAQVPVILVAGACAGGHMGVCVCLNH